MTTPARLRRDLSWPVPASDLQELDVIEILHDENGQVLWRVDEQPAAAPQDCPKALLRRGHADVPAVLAEAPDVLDMTTALQLRENLEFVDVPVLHALHAPPEMPLSWLVGSAVAASPAQLAQSSRVGDRNTVGASKVDDSTLLNAWPQVVEFVDTMEFEPSVHGPQVAAVESPAGPDTSAFDPPDLPMPHDATVIAAGRHPMVSAAVLSAWAAAARARVLSHIEPAERLGLVGGGMLLGVLFAVVGGSPLPATMNVGGAGHMAAHLASPVSADVAASGAMLARLRLVPTSFAEAPRVLPFPIAMPAVGAEAPGAKAAETFSGRGQLSAISNAPRPQAAPAVVGVLQRYAAAYNRQDARATAAVWPSADRQALVKTFSGLREQRLTLLSCTTAVTGNSATASCFGTRRYRPRVGDSSTRIQQGRWRFGLKRSAGTWLIASVAGPGV